MSNRLSFAHVTPRREPREWVPAARPSGFVAALRWLNSLADATANELPPSVQRDLGLPETAPAAVAFAFEIERSRVRV